MLPQQKRAVKNTEKQKSYPLKTTFSLLSGSVSDPDPYHLAGSGSASVNVDLDPGTKKNRDKLAYKSTKLAYKSTKVRKI